jgi:hypothetical protein
MPSVYFPKKKLFKWISPPLPVRDQIIKRLQEGVMRRHCQRAPMRLFLKAMRKMNQRRKQSLVIVVKQPRRQITPKFLSHPQTMARNIKPPISKRNGREK